MRDDDPANIPDLKGLIEDLPEIILMIKIKVIRDANFELIVTYV